MNTDPSKATKDFLDDIIAVKAPSVYLSESASGSKIFGNFMPGGNNRISDERRAQSLKILMRSAVSIPPPLTFIYEQEELSRVIGAKLVQKLINDQYIEVYQYHSSQRGGAMKLPRVLDPGWLELRPFGRERPEPVLGGDWDHDQSGRVTGAIGKRHNYRDFYEVLIGPKNEVRIDVVLEAINKPRIYCQCCFSSASREVENAIRALSIIPVEAGRLLLVCKDKAIANMISCLLKKEDNYQQLQKRISIKLFGDLLEYYHKRQEGGLL
jgi:hypothetical protein